MPDYSQLWEVQPPPGFCLIVSLDAIWISPVNFLHECSTDSSKCGFIHRTDVFVLSLTSLGIFCSPSLRGKQETVSHFKVNEAAVQLDEPRLCRFANQSG